MLRAGKLESPNIHPERDFRRTSCKGPLRSFLRPDFMWTCIVNMLLRGFVVLAFVKKACAEDVQYVDNLIGKNQKNLKLCLFYLW